MTVARKSMFAGLVAGLVALAACQSAGPGGSGPAGNAVDGEWMSSDGVAISTLNGGKFSSRVVATGETVTTGTYTLRDPRTIDLDFFSVKSQQNTKATCMLI